MPKFIIDKQDGSEERDIPYSELEPAELLDLLAAGDKGAEKFAADDAKPKAEKKEWSFSARVGRKSADEDEKNDRLAWSNGEGTVGKGRGSAIGDDDDDQSGSGDDGDD